MRLAYEQGLLRQKDLNYFQHWGLLYWLYMDRRTRVEDTQYELIAQTYNLFPERWSELYRAQILEEMGLSDEPMGDGSTVLDVEEDYDAFNAFVSQMESKRWMPAQALGLPADWAPDTVGTPV